MESMFFSEQFNNPFLVAALVLVTGGGLVSRAIAQVTGVKFAPVCFSLGWTAYSLQALAEISDHGRLLPSPESTVKVFNLDRDTGSMRINRSWTVDRLMRDLSLEASRKYPMRGDAMRILIYEAGPRPDVGATTVGYNRAHGIMAFAIAAQLAIAGATLSFKPRDWSVWTVTVVGIVSGSCFSSLPQWATEKLPHNQASKKTFALTAGRGSGDIIVIQGVGRCLDLEELSALRSPLHWGLWDRSQMFPAPRKTPSSSTSNSDSSNHRAGWWGGPFKMFLGRSLGFWLTVTASTIHAIIWLFVLVMVTSLKSSAWYLLLIAVVGSLANLIIASMELPSSARNIPLKSKGKIITTRDVRYGLMDGIMDLEDQFGCGKPLLTEFFPDKLEKDAGNWWKGIKEPYDRKRTAEAGRRGRPFLPKPDRDSQTFSSVEARSTGLSAITDFADNAPVVSQGDLGHQRATLEQGKTAVLIADSPASSPRLTSSPRISMSSEARRPAFSSRSSTGNTHETSGTGRRPKSVGFTDLEAQRESEKDPVDGNLSHFGLGIVGSVAEKKEEEEAGDNLEHGMVSPGWS